MQSSRRQRRVGIIRSWLLGKAMSQTAGALLVFVVLAVGFRLWTHKPVVFGLYAASVTGVLVASVFVGIHLQKQSKAAGRRGAPTGGGSLGAESRRRHGFRQD